MTTCHFRNCPGRPSGSTVRPDGIELLYCVAHEAIARNLPPLRSAGCCASEGCGRPRGQRSPLCKSCRPRYSAWGLDGNIPAQEAPMTEPTITPAPADDGEPSEGDVADAPLFVGGTDAAPAELVARWGQVHTAPPQPMPVDLDGLAAIAARGQQPTAPGSTVAELHAVCLLMQQLGSYGPDASAMLMRLLPVESRRALLEIEAADARGELARARANMVSPTTTEKLAEAAAKVAEVEARIAALDAGDVRG
jgi:hypothetical protein